MPFSTIACARSSRGTSSGVVAPKAGKLAAEPMPEAPAADILPVLGGASGRVLEATRYVVPAAGRDGFFAAMAELRGVRLRAGADFWRLYENVAHPGHFTELWGVRSWTDHLRELSRLSEQDHALIAAAALHQAPGVEVEAERFVHRPV